MTRINGRRDVGTSSVLSKTFLPRHWMRRLPSEALDEEMLHNFSSSTLRRRFPRLIPVCIDINAQTTILLRRSGGDF